MTSGTDKKNISDIEKPDSNKFVEMIQRKLAWYHPKPVRRVEIPKPDGRTRPLGIPLITDRIYCRCLNLCVKQNFTKEATASDRTGQPKMLWRNATE